MAGEPETDTPCAASADDSHRLQAAALWRRWRSRADRSRAAAAQPGIPECVPLPAEAWRHYRHFSWVVFEQRLLMLVLGALLAAVALVWCMALRLGDKEPVVVRSSPSLKQAAASFYGAPDASYNQLAFFLNACLPLLYAVDGTGHPLLPLAQGLVSPGIYAAAEARLNRSGKDVLAHDMTQALSISAITGVVADSASGRAAAHVSGCLVVTARRSEARFFPWRARVVVGANPPSRLDPYPYYLLRSEERVGPEAPEWDPSPGGAPGQ
jgi:hypothetical protein